MSPTPTAVNDQLVLSIVIIGKNEEQFIAQVLEAALKGAQAFPSYEVIYVDSASSDRTIEIASQYDIQIYQLRPEWKLAPSAGRYIGYGKTQGKYIFFIDGDSIIEPDWIKAGVAFLESHPKYGGTAGILNEAYLTPDGELKGTLKNYFRQDATKDKIEFFCLGGSALYRRQAIEQVGTFNPHVRAGEEEELGLRIRRGGWELARIGQLMSTKHTQPRATFYEIYRRQRSGLYDYGTAMRCASLYGGVWEFLTQGIPWVASTLFALIGLAMACVVAVIFGWQKYFLLILIVAIILFVLKKRSLKRALYTVTMRLAMAYRTLRSYLLTPVKHVADYPTDVLRIR
jgi:glycosyltransferase involved in cell wall biosynthesis